MSPASDDRHPEVLSLCERLGLESHVEGGWFTRLWEHEQADADGRRLASSIAYLFEDSHWHAWHRVDAAELWIHTAGAPVELQRRPDRPTDPDAEADSREVTVLGVGDPDGAPSATVEPGHWQRARSRGPWSLVVCVVVPEFTESGFDLFG